jgi:hypothetical protein
MNEWLIHPIALLGWTEIVLILAVLGCLALLAGVVVTVLWFTLRRRDRSSNGEVSGNSAIPPRL